MMFDGCHIKTDIGQLSPNIDSLILRTLDYSIFKKFRTRWSRAGLDGRALGGGEGGQSRSWPSARVGSEQNLKKK